MVAQCIDLCLEDELFALIHANAPISPHNHFDQVDSFHGHTENGNDKQKLRHKFKYRFSHIIRPFYLANVVISECFYSEIVRENQGEISSAIDTNDIFIELQKRWLR